MKGQVEVTFHWMYVLLAGTAFLLIFFFAIRSCTQATEERAGTVQLRSAASVVSLLAWQPRINTSAYFKDLEVTCPAGALTLSSGTDTVPLDQVPAFLSPELGGTSFMTHEIAIQTLPQITLGNALYGLDQDTYYFIISGPSTTGAAQIIGANRQVKQMDQEGLANGLLLVPKTAKAIVIAGEPLPQDSVLQNTPFKVYWVVVKDGELQFYESQGLRFNQTGVAKYAGDELVAGAIVSAKLRNYRCAAANVAARAQVVLKVAQSRSQTLLNTSAVCQSHYANALQEFQRLSSAQGTDFLNAAEQSTVLKTEQRSLYESSCPVIA